MLWPRTKERSISIRDALRAFARARPQGSSQDRPLLQPRAMSSGECTIADGIRHPAEPPNRLPEKRSRGPLLETPMVTHESKLLDLVKTKRAPQTRPYRLAAGLLVVVVAPAVFSGCT